MSVFSVVSRLFRAALLIGWIVALFAPTRIPHVGIACWLVGVVYDLALEVVLPTPVVAISSDPRANLRLHRFYMVFYAFAWPLVVPFKLWALLYSPKEARERAYRRAREVARKAMTDEQYAGFEHGLEMSETVHAKEEGERSP